MCQAYDLDLVEDVQNVLGLRYLRFCNIASLDFMFSWALNKSPHLKEARLASGQLLTQDIYEETHIFYGKFDCTLASVYYFIIIILFFFDQRVLHS